ncbi:MAG: SH3 domain-containing protein [Anaerolineae bacterium]
MKAGIRFVRFMAAVIAFTLILCQLGAVSIRGQAAEIAGELRILYPQVEFLRWNTFEWLSVRKDAQFPVSVDDAIRTDREGRALIQFGDSSAYLLPTSQLEIIEATPDRLIVHLTDGRLLVQTSNGGSNAIYVTTDRAQVDTPSAGYGVQVLADETSFISTSGTLEITSQAEGITMNAGQGMRIREQADPVVDLAGLNNFARIDSLLDGCPAVIQARGEASLNVRVGPSLAYDTLGSIENGMPVYLMAVSPGGERYRVQFLSGFGWVLATGIQHRCTDLPVLPYSAQERIIRVIHPSAEELSLMYPYFGAPEDDQILYILPEAEPTTEP